MSPVHVIVGEDPRAEAMWAEAFSGAIDLYRFDRNVEAFERLTAAAAPVDLVVLTPAQGGPFNLTPDQFIARVLESHIGSSRNLAGLHVIVVGQALTRSHPRAIEVATLDAAIRLVKFGEVQHAPRPAVVAAPASTPSTYMPGSNFSESVISRIWDAADSAERAERTVVGGGEQARAPQAPARAVQAAAPRQALQNQQAQLFERVAAPGFAAVQGGGAPHQAQVGAPGEAIEVSSGVLQSSRPYTLPNGGGYRGPELRQGAVPASSHHSLALSAPIPPALGAQVQQAVYGSATGAPDPVLVWSSSARGQVVAQGVPVPTAAPTQQQAPMAMAPAAMQQVRTVPMEPPTGIYGGGAAYGQQPHAPAPAAPVAYSIPTAPMAPAPASADPLLQRAERQNAAAVSFG
jgi:hypothetical protein